MIIFLFFIALAKKGMIAGQICKLLKFKTVAKNLQIFQG